MARWLVMSDHLVNDFLPELEWASHRCVNLSRENDVEVGVDDGLLDCQKFCVSVL